MTFNQPKCGVRTMASFKREARGPLPKKITWWHDAKFKLPGLSIADTRDGIEAAFMLARNYVPLPFERVTRQSAALIALMLGPAKEFDGAGGTLAMADMRSLYDPAPREIWFDPGDQFTLGAGSWKTLVLPVTCHELGHTFGFGHWPKPGALMSAIYDEFVTTPTKAELTRFFQEYPEWAAHR